MLRHEIKIRVRYAETDRMGYVYYGNYATYLEVARVEMLRSWGFSYRILEDEGVLLPVLDYSIRFIRPAFYDDELRIVTTLTSLPKARIKFNYEIFNSDDEKITLAETTLVFVDKLTGKPQAAPEELLQKLKNLGSF